MKLFICFLVLWFGRLLINLYYFFRIKKLYVIYINYWAKNSYKATQYKTEIIEIFKKAGIKDSRIGYSQPIGFGQLQTGTASVINNMFVNRNDILIAMNDYFNDAIGIFRKRIFQNFNIVYWIECILFLPRTIFEYLGLAQSNKIIKIFQVLYWIFSVVYAIYGETINKFIQDFLSRLFR